MNSKAATLVITAMAIVASASMGSVASAQAEVSAAATVAPARAQKANRDMITRADLDAKASANLHMIISSMRSHWLRGPANARSNMSITSRATSGGGFGHDPDASPTTGVSTGGAATTVVYVDGRRFGTIASLRTMPAETVEKVCYFPLNKAQGRFGMEVESPVIEVFTRGSSSAATEC